jgi:predicted RND superfamily exporter protein
MARSNLKLSLLRFSVHHPGLVLGLVLLAVGCSALLIPRVQLRLDASSLIPNGNPELLNSTKAANLFGLRDVVVLGVVNKNSCIYNPGTLSRLIRLNDALIGMEGVVGKLSRVWQQDFFQGRQQDRYPALIAEDKSFNADTIERIRTQVESMSLDDGVLAARSAAAIYAEVEPMADRYEPGVASENW